MIYPYWCAECDHEFDVIKSVAEIDIEEKCPSCQKIAERTIKGAMLMGVNDWTEQFNPAFGCVVKNKRHQREILAKFKGAGKEMVEIGSEPVEKLHKKYDTQREEVRNKRWSEPTEKIIQEVLR